MIGDANPRQYCILVAEDDPFLRYATAEVLQAKGYCVLQAEDGYEAIECAAKHDATIHAVVTNVRMPRMDGHELARQVKAMIPAIKVLIVSAQHESNFPPEARDHDFALLKPAAPRAILEKVEELLRQRGEKTTE